MEKGGNVYRFIVLLPSGYTAGPMRNLAPTNESSQLSEQSAQRDSTAKTTEEEKKQSRKFRVLPAEVVSTACPKGLEVGLEWLRVCAALVVVSSLRPTHPYAPPHARFPSTVSRPHPRPYNSTPSRRKGKQGRQADCSTQQLEVGRTGREGSPQ